jgi:hypothetical protein
MSLQPSRRHFGWTTLPAQRKKVSAMTFVSSTSSGRKSVDRPFYSRQFQIKLPRNGNCPGVREYWEFDLQDVVQTADTQCRKAPTYVCDCSLAKDSGIYPAMLAIINMILEPEMSA